MGVLSHSGSRVCCFLALTDPKSTVWLLSEVRPAVSFASPLPDTNSENDGPEFSRSSKVVGVRADEERCVGVCCGKRDSSVVVVAYVRG